MAVVVRSDPTEPAEQEPPTWLQKLQEYLNSELTDRGWIDEVPVTSRGYDCVVTHAPSRDWIRSAHDELQFVWDSVEADLAEHAIENTSHLFWVEPKRG